MHVRFLSVAHDVCGEWGVPEETVWGACVLCVSFFVCECVQYMNTDVLIILCVVLCGLCGSAYCVSDVVACVGIYVMTMICECCVCVRYLCDV